MKEKILFTVILVSMSAQAFSGVMGKAVVASALENTDISTAGDIDVPLPSATAPVAEADKGWACIKVLPPDIVTDERAVELVEESLTPGKMKRTYTAASVQSQVHEAKQRALAVLTAANSSNVYGGMFVRIKYSLDHAQVRYPPAGMNFVHCKEAARALTGEDSMARIRGGARPSRLKAQAPAGVVACALCNWSASV